MAPLFRRAITCSVVERWAGSAQDPTFSMDPLPAPVAHDRPDKTSRHRNWNDRFGSIATESGLSDRFRSTPGNGHRRTASACRKSARRVGFVMVAVMSDPPSTDISGAGLEYLNLPGTDILRMGILAIVALLPPRPNPILRSSIPASAGTNVYCGLVSVSSTEKS